LIEDSDIVVLSTTGGFAATFNLWFFHLFRLLWSTKMLWPVLVCEDGHGNFPNVDGSVKVPVTCLERSLWSAAMHTLLQPTNNLSFAIKNVLLFVATVVTTLGRIVFIDQHQPAMISIASQHS
jgi:hypothetical protein